MIKGLKLCRGGLYSRPFCGVGAAMGIFLSRNDVFIVGANLRVCPVRGYVFAPQCRNRGDRHRVEALPATPICNDTPHIW